MTQPLIILADISNCSSKFISQAGLNVYPQFYMARELETTSLLAVKKRHLL